METSLGSTTKDSKFMTRTNTLEPAGVELRGAGLGTPALAVGPVGLATSVERGRGWGSDLDCSLSNKTADESSGLLVRPCLDWGLSALASPSNGIDGFIG